jgi:hypothetical protein
MLRCRLHLGGKVIRHDRKQLSSIANANLQVMIFGSSTGYSPYISNAIVSFESAFNLKIEVTSKVIN